VAVRSIAWLGLTLAIFSPLKWYVKLSSNRGIGLAKYVPELLWIVSRPQVINEVDMRPSLPVILRIFVCIALIEVEKMPSGRIVKEVGNEQTPILKDLVDFAHERLGVLAAETGNVSIGRLEMLGLEVMMLDRMVISEASRVPN